MKKPVSNVAVLIFASSGQRDSKQKNIASSTLVFNQLTQQMKTTVQVAGLPCILITDKEQQGDSFGARLKNAMDRVYQQGYTGVIAIGNDTPHLKPSHIKQAAARLQKGLPTIGPSADGGFYLLGLDKHAFAKANQSSSIKPTFEHIAWKTSTLLKELLQCIDQEVLLLDCLQDLDRLEDVVKILKAGRPLNALLLQLLLFLWESKKPCYQTTDCLIATLPQGAYHNRGSPY